MEQKENEIIFYGEINVGLIEIRNEIKNEWLKYKLSFKETIYYKCYELDFYTKEKSLESSFDKINDSKIIERMKLLDRGFKITNEHKHFVLATYDYIYEIIASEYIFEIEIN
jgi:hypothetical protein